MAFARKRKYQCMFVGCSQKPRGKKLEVLCMWGASLSDGRVLIRRIRSYLSMHTPLEANVEMFAPTYSQFDTQAARGCKHCSYLACDAHREGHLQSSICAWKAPFDFAVPFPL